MWSFLIRMYNKVEKFENFVFDFIMLELVMKFDFRLIYIFL